MNYPKITIITVCLNSEEVIEKTIQSVVSQNYKNIEYIIIDGNSSDGTLDIIKKYQSSISRLVSEKDSGIYNAMNKGLRLMSGDMVLFLNAGDFLYDNEVIKDVASVFAEKPKIQILYGNIVTDHDGKRRLRKYNNIDRLFFACAMICHQVIFASRELFDEYGYFDERFTRNADYDWFLNIFFRKEVLTYYLDRTISVYDMRGLSSSQLKFLDEMITSKKKYFSKLEMCFYYPTCIIRQRFRKIFFEKRV